MYFCWAMLKTQKTCIFQKLIRIKGRSARKYVIFLKINSPTSFSVYVIFFCTDSTRETRPTSCKTDSMPKGSHKITARSGRTEPQRKFGKACVKCSRPWEYLLPTTWPAHPLGPSMLNQQGGRSAPSNPSKRRNIPLRHLSASRARHPQACPQPFRPPSFLAVRPNLPLLTLVPPIPVDFIPPRSPPPSLIFWFRHYC